MIFPLYKRFQFVYGFVNIIISAFHYFLEFNLTNSENSLTATRFTNGKLSYLAKECFISKCHS